MKHHSKNLLSLVGYDAGTRLLGFVTTAYIARIVGNEGFGVLNYAMAFLSYAFLLASPGLHTVGTRAASRRDSAEGYLVSDVSNVRLLLSVVVGIVMSVGAVYGTGNVELRTIILLYSASLIPYALQLEWFFQGKEDVQTIGLYRFIAGAAYLAAVLLMLHSRADLATVPVAFLIAAVVNAAALFILFRKRYAGALPGRSLKVLRLRWRKILAESLPVGYGSLLSQIVLSLPIILLGLFASVRNVGDFSAAWKITFFLLAVDRAVYLLFYPLVARTFAERPDALPVLLNRILRYTMLALVPLSIGLAVTSRPLVLFVFGDGFSSAAPMLHLLSLYFFFTVLNSIFGYALIAVGGEKRYSYVMTVFSAVTAALLLPLVYYKSGWGASAGMALGEFLMMILLYREINGRIPFQLMAAVLKPLGASLLMGMCVLVTLPAGLFLSVAAGMIVYAGVISLMNGVTREDIVFLKGRFL